MNKSSENRRFGTFSTLPLAVVLATLSLIVMSASPSRQEGSAHAIASATITAPPTPSFSLNTAGQDPGDFVLSNFNAGDTLNVSVGFVNPPSGTTFALPTTTGLTAGFGYNFTGGKTQISFTGTMANANAALAAMTVSTGATNGTITIRVTASVNTASRDTWPPSHQPKNKLLSTRTSTLQTCGSAAPMIKPSLTQLVEPTMQTKMLRKGSGHG